MKEVNKLVDIVTSRLRKNYDILDLSGEMEDPSKEQQLYNGVLSGIYKTDEEAATGMYESDIYDQRFRMLKSRLRHKLYDLLFHVEFNDSRYKIATQHLLECKEYLYKANILFTTGEYSMAEKQVNKAFAIAEEAEFTRVLVDGYDLLRIMHANNCKPTDFEEAIEKLESLRKLSNIEEYANDLFFKNSMLLKKSVHSRNISVQTTNDNVMILENLWKETGSVNIYEKYYRLKMWYFELVGDYKKLIAFSLLAEKDIENGKINPTRFDVRYNVFIRTYAYLNVEDFKAGFESAEEGKKIIESTTRNWFAHMENYFLLAMHSKDYDRAEKIMNEVYDNSSLKKVSQSASERWRLFKAYLNFAVPEKQIIKRLTFNDFYISMTYYNKDKKGYNISLIILEFLHMLGKNKFDVALNKLDNLEKYYYRYLNEPGKNPREKQFFKLIKVLVNSGFDTKVAAETGLKYVENLTTKAKHEPYTDPEIIPYEHLWDLMLDTVEKNKSHIVYA